MAQSILGFCGRLFGGLSRGGTVKIEDKLEEEDCLVYCTWHWLCVRLVTAIEERWKMY